MARRPGDARAGGRDRGVPIVADHRPLVRTGRREREVGIAVEVEIHTIDEQRGAADDGPGAQLDAHPPRTGTRVLEVEVDEPVAGFYSLRSVRDGEERAQSD